MVIQNIIENLRNLGQFWTPEWISDAMIAYLLKNNVKEIFDPAVGNGVFFKSLRKFENSNSIKFLGIDIDNSLINNLNNNFSSTNNFFELRDFLFNSPDKKFDSIIANPPYIRHHRISIDAKRLLGEMCYKITGFKIDGRAGIHVYFLIKALTLLKDNGYLIFILPSDICEGIFSKKLWNWVIQNYCIEKVITFSTEATPFPNIDTNAIIFCISNKRQEKIFKWLKVKRRSECFLDYMYKDKSEDCDDFIIVNRDINEGLINGFSRTPGIINNYKYHLKDFAKIIRGVATGSNEFFFLTKNKIIELGIPKNYLKIALGRTRDIKTNIITKKIVEKLELEGRPTFLLYLNNEPKEELPLPLQDYLNYGESIGIDKKVLISTRQPWYKMEKREPPEFLFTYLGRRNSRFIKNEAEVIPLTSFLCVYSHFKNIDYINKLWIILNDESTINNINLVGKSYGSGAIKVEPKALANLPISENLVEKLDILPYKPNQIIQNKFNF